MQDLNKHWTKKKSVFWASYSFLTKHYRLLFTFFTLYLHIYVL